MDGYSGVYPQECSPVALVRYNVLDTRDQNKRLNNSYCDFELKTIEAGTWQLLFSLFALILGVESIKLYLRRATT